MVCLSQTLIAVVGLFFAYPCCGDQRDYFIEAPTRRSEIAHFRYSLFPTFKHCEAVPRQPEETEEEKKLSSFVKIVKIEPRTMKWSSLVNKVILPDEHTITTGGKEMLKKAYSKKPSYILIIFSIFIFIVVGIFVGCASAFIIPFIGCFIFVILRIIYICLTNRLFRKVGRWLLIQVEWTRRTYELKLIEKSQINRQPPPPRFRLPKFFRDFSEEEIPEELLAPHGTYFGSSESDIEINGRQASQQDIASGETREKSDDSLEKQFVEPKSWKVNRRSLARRNAERKRHEVHQLKLKRLQEMEDLKLAIKKEKQAQKDAKKTQNKNPFRLLQFLKRKKANTSDTG